MAGKFKHKKEWIVALVALGLSFLILGAAAAYVLIFVLPEGGNMSGVLDWILPTESTAPTLVPNPYDAGDFGYDNGYLTCLSGRSMLGIDVSSHQKFIDWQAVAGEGVEFAMVRVGYRGWGNGQILPDEMAQTNLQGAADAGLQLGVYFYSQAVSEEEARQEAQFVLEQLGGRQLQLPVVFDWEIFSEQGRTANVDAETLERCIFAFCDTIEAAGYDTMLYFNLDISMRLLDLVGLQEKGFPFWLAMYTDQMTYPHRVDMWQYSESGRVKGIEGNVDLNLYFVYEE